MFDQHRSDAKARGKFPECRIKTPLPQTLAQILELRRPRRPARAPDDSRCQSPGSTTQMRQWRAESEIGRHENPESAWPGVSEKPARLPELLEGRKSRPRFPFRRNLHIEAIATSMSPPAIGAAAVSRSQPAAVQAFDRSAAAGGKIIADIGGYPRRQRRPESMRAAAGAYRGRSLHFR